MGIYIAAAIIAYFIGSINFSVIISKRVAGFDIREKGSKNAGTTNMLRTVGKWPALVVLICDILKGVVSVLIAKLMADAAGQNEAIAIQLAAFFVVLGHTYPIFFEFRGGKGIATSIGALFLINWEIALICVIYGLLILILTRMVSLGSISAAILFPVLTIFVDTHYIAGGGFSYVIFGIALAALIIFNHRENIKRLMDGTENRISFKKESNIEE